MATSSNHNVEQRELSIPITFDNRSYNDIIASLEESSEEYLTKNYLLHERAWYDESSKKLEQSRRRWEDEIKVMRDQFFSMAPHQLQKQRAAALMDTYTFDQLTTRNVRATCGQLFFHIRFEVKDFDKQRINVSFKGSRITIKVVAGDSSNGNCRELMRCVNIPHSALGVDRITAVVTSDDVLLVAVPLKSPNPEVEHKCVPPTMSSSMEMPQLMECSGDKLVRLQTFLGSYYKPDEISVLVGEHCVKVSARHEEKASGKTCFREFQREWDLPKEVISGMARASLTPAGNLIVEAPMLPPNLPSQHSTEDSSVDVTYADE